MCVRVCVCVCVCVCCPFLMVSSLASSRLAGVQPCLLLACGPLVQQLGEIRQNATAEGAVDLYATSVWEPRLARCRGHAAVVAQLDWSRDSQLLQTNWDETHWPNRPTLDMVVKQLGVHQTVSREVAACQGRHMADRHSHTPRLRKGGFVANR